MQKISQVAPDFLRASSWPGVGLIHRRICVIQVILGLKTVIRKLTLCDPAWFAQKITFWGPPAKLTLSGEVVIHEPKQGFSDVK